MCNEQMEKQTHKNNALGRKDNGHEAVIPAPIRHTIEPQDTFMSLSIKYGVSAGQIQRANGFRPGDQLFARKEIVIPSPSSEEKEDSVSKSSRQGEHIKRKPKSKGLDKQMESEGATPSPEPASASEAGDTRGRQSDTMEKFGAFLSRFDKKLAVNKSSSDKIGARMSHIQGETPMRRSRLNLGTMTTTAGRLMAEGQAQGFIERILICNPGDNVIEVAQTEANGAHDNGMRLSTMQPRKIEFDMEEENNLDKDVSIFTL